MCFIDFISLKVTVLHNGVQFIMAVYGDNTCSCVIINWYLLA